MISLALRCDACKRPWLGGGRDADTWRRSARAMGWTHELAGDRIVDTCAMCNEAKRALAKLGEQRNHE